MIAGLLLLTALALFALLFTVGVIAVQRKERTGVDSAVLAVVGQWLMVLILVSLFAAGFIGLGYLVGVLHP